MIWKPDFWDLLMRVQQQKDSPSDSKERTVERRRVPRSPAGIIGSIRLFGAPPEKCMIEDVSVDGAKVLRFFSGQLPRFLNLEIEPGMTVPASIVWEDEERLGLKFAHNIGAQKAGSVKRET